MGKSGEGTGRESGDSRSYRKPAASALLIGDQPMKTNQRYHDKKVSFNKLEHVENRLDNIKIQQQLEQHAIVNQIMSPTNLNISSEKQFDRPIPAELR